MWNIGDIIRFVENGENDSTEDNGLEINEVYEIIEKMFDPDDSYADYQGWKYAVRLPSEGMWWIEPNSFSLVKPKKKKAKTEKDVLDNIQENFKLGY